MTELSIRIACSKCGSSQTIENNDEFNRLIELACISLGQSTPEIYESFGIANSGGRWDIDDDEGVIRFTQAGGRACTAQFDFIGTWADESETFKWGWDHPYATNATRFAADQVYEIGQQIDAIPMTTNLIGATENDVWHLAKLAAYLAERPATYRARANEKAWMYFAFANPAWVGS